MYEHDFCEYAVKKKMGGAYLAKLVLALAAAAVFVVCFFALILPAVGLFFGAIIFTLFATLMWYLSRFTAVEYEYTQTGAFFDVASVYNKQYRREQLSIDLKKSAYLVAPLAENTRAVDDLVPKYIHDFRSSPDVPNAYVILYDAENGSEALLFDASVRMIENIRRQVPSKTHLADGLPEL